MFSVPKETYIYVGCIAILAILLGASVVWNIFQLRAAQLASLQQDKAVIAALNENLRRRGTVIGNDPITKKIRIAYVAAGTTVKKRMEITLSPAANIQRTSAIKNSEGVIVGVKAARILQENVRIGEDIYLITKPTTVGESFETSTVFVGDILQRQ